jgi:hypothetical protein
MFFAQISCGLCYKPMTIVNYDSRVVNKFEASLTAGARVVIYNCHMFKVLVTGVSQAPEKPGAVFTTLHFLRNLRIGPIS